MKMVGTGGVKVARNTGTDRFYNPPPIRKQLEQQQKQQEQEQEQQERLQRQRIQKIKNKSVPDIEEEQIRVVSDDCSPSKDSSNLDRFIESTSPVVPLQFANKKSKGRRSYEVESRPFFILSDLWESFKEWSAYGAGVPLVLNECDSVVQYYVPYLSGIQLYPDLSKSSSSKSKKNDDSNPESMRGTGSEGSNDCEQDRQTRKTKEGHVQNYMESTTQRIEKLSLRDMDTENFPREDNGIFKVQHLPTFEYFECEPPYAREPLADKIASLANQFPDLKTFKSCDLLPISWISVAWYPIYRIPTGPTLRDLDGCFLTFHPLSTSPTSSNHQISFPNVRKISNRMQIKLTLPMLGLASYKFKTSVWAPNKTNERQQVTSLLEAADNWLRQLHVDLPDFRFFITHNIEWS